MDIIGLGKAGCAIAKTFEAYPQYERIYKIDNDLSGDKCLSIAKKMTAEEYENNIPYVRDFFQELGDEVIFIMAGSGLISSLCLGILEQIKNKKITILYIVPSNQSLMGQKKLLDKIAFGVLQEYTRSGLFESMYIIDNQSVINHIGNLSVIGYWNRVNELISSTMHFINVFSHTTPVYETECETNVTNRIKTIGILNPDTSEEKMFYPLQLTREKNYFYAFRNDLLVTESNIIKKIEDKLETKKEKWLTSLSYRLYASSYEYDLGYCVFSTSKVQDYK